MSTIKSLKEVDRTKKVSLKIIHTDPLIKLKKFAGAYTTISPGLDSNGNPATGLTEDFKTGNAMTKGTRKAMEELLQMPEGELKNTSTYWDTFGIRIDSEKIDFDLSDDTDLLKWLFVKAQSIVANGYKELESNAKAEFLLFSEEQEAAIKVKSRRTLKEAFRISDSLDEESRRTILDVYGVDTSASSISVIENKLDEKIEEDPDKFIEISKDNDLELRSLFAKLTSAGIITTKEGNYVHNEVPLGYDKETSIQALKKNNNLQIILKAKLSGDMDLIRESLTNTPNEID